MKKILIAFIFIMFCIGGMGGNAFADTFGNYVSCTMGSNVLADAEGEDAEFTCVQVTNSEDFPACADSSPCRVSIRTSTCSTFTGCAAREIVTVKTASCVTGTCTLTVKTRNQESTTHSGDWSEGDKVDMVLTAGQILQYPDAGVGVSTGSAWDTSLSTDGSGDCGSGAVCLGDHTHSGYQLTDQDLTDIAGLSCDQNQIFLRGVAAWECASNFPFVSISDAVIWLNGGNTYGAIFETSGITGSNKTITIPNRSLTVDNITTSTTTDISGLLKGDTGAVVQATAGTDYYAPGSTDVAIADGGTGTSTGSITGPGALAFTSAADNTITLATGTSGTEKVVDGTFSVGGLADWVLGTGWTDGTGTAYKSGDGTGTLTQAVSIPATIGVAYDITYTVSSWTVGTVICSYGGVSDLTINSNGIYSFNVVATSTDSLAFTPSNTSRFKIDDVSVKPAQPVVVQNATDSASSFQVRRQDTTPIFTVGSVPSGIMELNGTFLIKNKFYDTNHNIYFKNTTGNDRAYVGFNGSSSTASFFNGVPTGGFQIGTGGAWRFYFSASGNIGIGASNPTYALSFGNDAAKSIWIENSAEDTIGRALTINAGSTIAGATVNIAGGNLILNSGLGKGTGASNIVFNTGRTLTTGSTLQTLTPAMTILGSGNVGIGTTTPEWILDMYKNQDGDSMMGIRNPNGGTSARAGFKISNGSAYAGSSFFCFVTGSAYTGGGGYWQNRVVLSSDSGITGGILIRPGAGPVQIIGNASLNDPNLVVATTGYVGIGRNDPTQKLDIKDGISVITQTTKPTCACSGGGSCATSTNDTDESGTMTCSGGGASTTMTLTFNITHARAPVCLIQAVPNLATSYQSTLSTTAPIFTITSTTNPVARYICR